VAWGCRDGRTSWPLVIVGGGPPSITRLIVVTASVSSAVEVFMLACFEATFGCKMGACAVVRVSMPAAPGGNQHEGPAVFSVYPPLFAFKGGALRRAIWGPVLPTAPGVCPT
jgi:hypothetical protein